MGSVLCSIRCTIVLEEVGIADIAEIIIGESASVGQSHSTQSSARHSNQCIENC